MPPTIRPTADLPAIHSLTLAFAKYLLARFRNRPALLAGVLTALAEEWHDYLVINGATRHSTPAAWYLQNDLKDAAAAAGRNDIKSATALLNALWPPDAE